MAGYGYQTYQHMLVEEGGVAKKEKSIREQLKQNGLLIERMKRERTMNTEVIAEHLEIVHDLRKKSNRLTTGINDLAYICDQLNKSLNKQHATN